MKEIRERKGADILGVHIDALTWQDALSSITRWAHGKESRYVCICNVHSVVTARRLPEFNSILNEADMATPDGMPLAWYLRRSGFLNQPRINGPDLFLEVCLYAEQHDVPVFLYGGNDSTLTCLRHRLAQTFPNLPLAGSYSPPFRESSEQEEREIAAMINESGARVVFVALGCPKQESWMARQRGQVKAVMIGVGAAFDYHAGIIRRAPRWMQNSGLEWLHRLGTEPRRLWKRYLVTNSLFVYFLALDFVCAGARRGPQISEIRRNRSG